MKYTTIALAALAVLATTAHAAPAMMSPEWTAQACDAWNKDGALTGGLADQWIKNDKDRGYKIIHLYRTDCGEATQTELKIMGKAGPLVALSVLPRINGHEVGSMVYRWHTYGLYWCLKRIA